MGLSGGPARTKPTPNQPRLNPGPEPPGGSKTSTGSIDRDLGTSGRPLGISDNDECIVDRGLGSFMDFQELPKHLQGASYEPLEASLTAFWCSPDRLVVHPYTSRTSKSDAKCLFSMQV